MRRLLHAYGEVVRAALADGLDEDGVLRRFEEAVGAEARAGGAEAAMRGFWQAFEIRHHVQGYVRYLAGRARSA
ncbi:MAG: hypothetical protein HY660_07860 [Armatimonadetes bacterium]|nr:hypothetical protein [Armatimonadota bacterium]